MGMERVIVSCPLSLVPCPSPLAGLRSVVTLDDDHVGDRGIHPVLHCFGILRRFVTGHCRSVVLELDDHVARARLSFLALEPAAAYQEARAVLGESFPVRGHIALVALRVIHVDMHYPVPLRHLLLPDECGIRIRSMY